MTKKYEKFEEWMLHTPVVACNGVRGRVIRQHGLGFDGVLVCADSGEIFLSRLSGLKFVEKEKEMSTENEEIKWEVGQEVWCLMYGKGEVVSTDCDGAYPIMVRFDGGYAEAYTKDGKYFDYFLRTLFFSEPTIIADTMPPKKPFVPKLKEGDKVVIRNHNGNLELYTVMGEDEDVLYTNGLDFRKDRVKVFTLEEVKFD